MGSYSTLQTVGQVWWYVYTCRYNSCNLRDLIDYKMSSSSLYTIQGCSASHTGWKIRLQRQFMLQEALAVHEASCDQSTAYTSEQRFELVYLYKNLPKTWVVTIFNVNCVVDNRWGSQLGCVLYQWKTRLS